MRYKCPKCGDTFAVQPPSHVCPICDAPLLVEPETHEAEPHGDREGIPSPRRRL